MVLGGDEGLALLLLWSCVAKSIPSWVQSGARCTSVPASSESRHQPMGLFSKQVFGCKGGSKLKGF